MSLVHRVARQQAGQGPGPDLSEVGRYNTPAEMPNVRIAITPTAIGYQDLLPIYTADGAPVAATGAGTWGQLYAVGRS